MSKKVLIVDDESGLRKELNLLLSDEGYNVTEAPDGRTAIELLSKEKFDLVISDILMPNVDGIELLMHVSENYPAAQIIAISGGGRSTMRTGQLDYLEMAKRLASVKTVLQKPFSGDELLRAVRDLIGN